MPDTERIEAQARADDLRRRLKAAGCYFTVDIAAQGGDTETCLADLAEIIGRLHANDVAALWVVARELEGTSPNPALWTGPSRPLTD